jgi:molecular chaperone IbpA
MSISLLQSFLPELYATPQTQYNIVRSNNGEFILELNVGFDETHIYIELAKNRLIVSSFDLDEPKTYLYKSFQPNSFNHMFLLNESAVVKSAKVKNGVLSITLSMEVPEEHKPKKIPITH